MTVSLISHSQIYNFCSQFTTDRAAQADLVSALKILYKIRILFVIFCDSELIVKIRIILVSPRALNNPVS